MRSLTSSQSLRDDPDKFLKAMPAWGALTEKCLSTPPRSTGPYMTEMDVLEDINPINDVQEVRKSELERNVKYASECVIRSLPLFCTHPRQFELHPPAAR